MDQHGQKGKRPVGDDVPIDSWAQCLTAHVQECIDCDTAPFPIGSYVRIGKGHARHASLVEDDVHHGTGGRCQLHQALLSAGVLGEEVATTELNKQGCRPVGLWSCTGNQVCDGALQGHGAATQKV